MTAGRCGLIPKVFFLLALVFLLSCQNSSNQDPTSSTIPRRFDAGPEGSSCVLTGESGPGDFDGIINGQALASSSRIARGTVFIASLEMENGALVEARCTGVLIGPSLVLTAAHCLPEVTAQNRSQVAANTRVFFSVAPNCGTLPDSGSSQQRGVARVLVHPQYLPEEQVYDLALIFLDQPAPLNTEAIPIQWDTSGVTSATPIYVAGYGRDTDLSQGAPGEPRLRYTALYLSVDPNLPPRSAGHPPDDLVVLDADRGSGVCSGDSGGPALISGQGRLWVVGIASFVYDYDGEQATCLSRAAYTRLGAFQDWLLSEVPGSLSRSFAPF